MQIEWSPVKNAELKERHGFGFERVLIALSEGALLDERAHPNVERYAHQRQLVVAIEGYAWIVPFVTDGETIFLKTMFPSRNATKDYLGG
ncbi:toxin [Mesorhizobium sp. LHD-90]|uniref:toxin n=1 Tax=Mesorhizobium sp. LHD-90 TaxID=3071414 RepID=UPI0027E1971F|nr:toxin [Mesorhizobium sp. LHD-90]MDQ6434465.1 toxin [Mesorhizobium sp. LHD-90]